GYSLPANSLGTKFTAMAYVQTVHPLGPDRKRSSAVPLAQASIRLITGDVLGSFADEVQRWRGRVQRLTIVSPWVTYSGSATVLERLLERAESDQAAVVLVTRPSTSASHAAAIAAV